MDFVKNALSDAADTVTGAADHVAHAVGEAGFNAAAKFAEEKVFEYTKRRISIEPGEIPSDWMPWMLTTGLNSLKCDDTWDFLDFEPGKASARKRIENWNDRGIETIIMSVKQDEPDQYEQWRVCDVSHAGSKMTITWWPRAHRWSGHNCWWIIRDEIIFGLQLYQLEGKCFYKSDWVENFEDVDPNSCLPNGTTTYKRWLQFRHWTIMWYAKAREGWNYQYTKKPPRLPDGSDFNLSSILDLPDLPSLPSITLPTLPDIELPTIEAPSLPSIEAPSLSAPSLDPSLSMPSMEDRKERPKNPWACHGIIEMNGLNVKAKGSTLVLSDATVHNFWQKGGYIETEKVEHKRFELTVSNADQADSWVESLKEGGAKDGDVGGCCTIA